MGRLYVAGLALLGASLGLLAAPAARAQCAAGPEDPSLVPFTDLLSAASLALHPVWNGGPISAIHEAHKTNTTEQFSDAMTSGVNWFEGDIRFEINDPHTLEMRHDPWQEPGDNLTLAQWLAKGAASGRGLKLDIKDSAGTPAMLDQVAAAGIPDDRLMFNYGTGEMRAYAGETRRRFPGAIIAYSVPGDPSQPFPLARVPEAIAETFRAGGGPITFVLNARQATPAVVAAFEKVAPVSIWGDADDPVAVARHLRAIGVTGEMDVEKKDDPSLRDKVTTGYEYGVTWAEKHWPF